MEGLRERSRKNVLGVWNLGAGGCRGDVIGAEELEKNNSLSLFRSSLQSQQGREKREGEGKGGWLGRQPWQGLLGNGKGCQAGSAANISGSHLCSLKPGVLPKASFQLPAMITLDVGQFLRARNPLCCARPLSLSFKGSLPNMQQFPWRRRAEHKK